MVRFALFVLFVMAGAPPVSAEDSGGGLHVLKGRIIRSLAIDVHDPAHILVGHKAKAPGSALVFRSLDGGKTWRTLNGNNPLHPQATDVQAVLPLSRKIILAGTEKQGLYVSRDGGARFGRVRGFPSTDIRDLQSAGGDICRTGPS